MTAKPAAREVPTYTAASLATRRALPWVFWTAARRHRLGRLRAALRLDGVHRLQAALGAAGDAAGVDPLRHRVGQLHPARSSASPCSAGTATPSSWCASTSFGALLSSSLVAYGFARLRFRGRNLLFMILLATMMLPGQVTLIPTYYFFSRIHWMDSLRPLIVPAYFAAPSTSSCCGSSS